MRHLRSSHRIAVLLATATVLIGGPVRAEPPAPERPSGQAPASAEADDASDPLAPEAAFQRAVSFYDSGHYAECAAAFAELLSTEREPPLTSDPIREGSRVYAAACLIAEGRLEEADEQFRLAIRANPQIGVPSSVVFPQPVVDRFILVRSDMLDEIRQAQEERARQAREEADRTRQEAIREQQRIAGLERLAKQETIVIRNRRWLASVPFGVGQFQNRKYGLGAFFLTSELLLAGTAITAVSIELSLISQASAAPLVSRADEEEINADIRTARSVSLIAAGGLLLTAIVGITEAHLSFVPEFRDGVRTRKAAAAKKPRSVAVQPTAFETPLGSQLGISGSF